MADRTTGSTARTDFHRRKMRGSVRDTMLRQLVAEAARVALEERAHRAPDPVACLRTAAAEVLQIVALLESTSPSEEARMRAIVAQEVEAVADALIRRLES